MRKSYLGFKKQKNRLYLPLNLFFYLRFNEQRSLLQGKTYTMIKNINEEVQERGQVETRELLTVCDGGSVSNSRSRGISFEVDCIET